MTRYVKSNIVYTIDKIREQFKNVSIPDNADLEDLGYSKLILTEPPVKDGFIAIEDAPVNNVQTWKLIEIKPTVPLSITLRQANIILYRMGLLNMVEEELKKDEESYLEWSKASSVDRYNPLIISIGRKLNLSPEDIDNMFIEASKII